MPRQIIDTKSSRPAYLRRRAVTWIVAIVVVIAIGLAVFELLKSQHVGAGALVTLLPGNLLAQGNLGPIPHDRRGHAA